MTALIDLAVPRQLRFRAAWRTLPMTSVHDAEESVAAADGKVSDSVVGRSWVQDAFRPMVSFPPRRQRDCDLLRSTARIGRHPPEVGCNTYACSRRYARGAGVDGLRLDLTSVGDKTGHAVAAYMRLSRESGIPRTQKIHPTSPRASDGALLPWPASACPARGLVSSWPPCQLDAVSPHRGPTRRTVASCDFRKHHQEGVPQSRTDS